MWTTATAQLPTSPHPLRRRRRSAPPVFSGPPERQGVAYFSMSYWPTFRSSRLSNSTRCGLVFVHQMAYFSIDKNRHFDVPECVTSATLRFKQTTDAVAMFVAECCKTGSDYYEQAQPLCEAYNAWCITNHHEPKTSVELAMEWQRLGFWRNEVHGVKRWHGLSLVRGGPDYQ